MLDSSDLVCKFEKRVIGHQFTEGWDALKSYLVNDLNVIVTVWIGGCEKFELEYTAVGPLFDVDKFLAMGIESGDPDCRGPHYRGHKRPVFIVISGGCQRAEFFVSSWVRLQRPKVVYYRLRDATALPFDDFCPGARIVKEWEVDTLDAGGVAESSASAGGQIKCGSEISQSVGGNHFNSGRETLTEIDLVDILGSFRVSFHQYGPRIAGKKLLDGRFEIGDVFMRSTNLQPRILKRIMSGHEQEARTR